MARFIQALCVFSLFSTIVHAGFANKDNMTITIVNKSKTAFMLDLGLSECSGIIDAAVHGVRPGESVTAKAHSAANKPFEWLFYFLAGQADEVALLVYATDAFFNANVDESRFVLSKDITYSQDTAFVVLEIRDRPSLRR